MGKIKRRKLTIIERLPIVAQLRKERPGMSPWYYRKLAEDPGWLTRK